VRRADRRAARSRNRQVSVCVCLGSPDGARPCDHRCVADAAGAPRSPSGRGAPAGGHSVPSGRGRGACGGGAAPTPAAERSNLGKDWQNYFIALSSPGEPMNLPGFVHEGFSRQFREGLPLVTEALAQVGDPAGPVGATGHSLGGALATLFGVRSTRDGAPARVVAAFAGSRAPATRRSRPSPRRCSASGTCASPATIDAQDAAERGRGRRVRARRDRGAGRLGASARVLAVPRRPLRARGAAANARPGQRATDAGGRLARRRRSVLRRILRAGYVARRAAAARGVRPRVPGDLGGARRPRVWLRPF
jgi:hypothetical protein